MKKPVILITKPESLGELSALQKAHVKGYTRSDGTFVKEHDTSVTAKPKHSAATLSALADQHEAESERQDKLATKKGADHPDYEKHVIASAHHAKAQRHAEKARDAKDEGERDAHLAEHARYKGLAEKAEGAIGKSSASKPKAGG